MTSFQYGLCHYTNTREVKRLVNFKVLTSSSNTKLDGLNCSIGAALSLSQGIAYPQIGILTNLTSTWPAQTGLSNTPYHGIFLRPTQNAAK